MRAWKPLWVLAALGLGLAVFALDWPIQPAEPVAGFGTPVRGGPLLGTALAAEAGLVRAASAGEVIFAREHEDPRTVLPSALGATAVVEQAGAMVALYGHLAPRTIPVYLKELKAGDTIGAAGESGLAAGRGLFFSLYDREAGRWVNPLLLMPPLADATPPQVRHATLIGKDKRYPLGEARSLPQGSYSLAIEVIDPTGSRWSPGPSAPFYVRVLVDGEKYGELRYEVAEAKAGVLNLFPASKDGASFHAQDGSTILPARLFHRGKTLIELLARDYVGNERTLTWSILVE